MLIITPSFTLKTPVASVFDLTFMHMHKNEYRQKMGKRNENMNTGRLRKRLSLAFLLFSPVCLELDNRGTLFLKMSYAQADACSHGLLVSLDTFVLPVATERYFSLTFAPFPHPWLPDV